MKAFISNVMFAIGMLIFGSICYYQGVNSVSTDMPTIQEYKSSKELQS